MSNNAQISELIRRLPNVVIVGGDMIEGFERERSVVDQLAEIATPVDEIHRRMNLAADQALARCRESWPDLGPARVSIRNLIRAVYKGKRFSGFNPKKATDRILAARMRVYKKDLAAHKREDVLDELREWKALRQEGKAAVSAAANRQDWRTMQGQRLAVRFKKRQKR